MTSTENLAALFEVSVATVHRWRRRGIITPIVYRSRGIVRYDGEEAVAAIRAHAEREAAA